MRPTVRAALTVLVAIGPVARVFAQMTPQAITHRDRVYAAEQYSNTVSVIDPADNRLLGVIALGDPLPGNLSPLYRGQTLVHGLGFSSATHTLAVVSVASNSVAFVDTRTNAVKHTTYVGRAPHEAAFTPDGRELWVTVRGEDYISVLDTKTYRETQRITLADGPGMATFSPDGLYGYVCSSFSRETAVIRVTDHAVVARVPQPSPLCPNIAASPEGDQVWLTLKDIGKVVVLSARPPFNVLRTIDTGPITNHVNFAHTSDGTFAYVTVGGLNEVQVYRTDNFRRVQRIPVGALPHGLWPSTDGQRVYVGLENGDKMVVIDVPTNRVVATVPIGQAPQAVVYVHDAVPDGSDGMQGLQPLGSARTAVHFNLVATGAPAGSENAATSVTLFDQGVLQVFQAAVTGLEPGHPYFVGLARQPDGGGAIEAIAPFMTNPAGAAMVNAIGPLRHAVEGDATTNNVRRYLVIVSGTPAAPGQVVQLQRPGGQTSP